MRESIGKAIKSNKWITGYYVFSSGRHYILEKHGEAGYDAENHDWIEVTKESVTERIPYEPRMVCARCKNEIYQSAYTLREYFIGWHTQNGEPICDDCSNLNDEENNSDNDGKDVSSPMP